MSNALRMSFAAAQMLHRQLDDTNRRLASPMITDARRSRLLRRKRDLQQLLKGAR